MQNFERGVKNGKSSPPQINPKCFKTLESSLRHFCSFSGWLIASYSLSWHYIQSPEHFYSWQSKVCMRKIIASLKTRWITLTIFVSLWGKNFHGRISEKNLFWKFMSHKDSCRHDEINKIEKFFRLSRFIDTAKVQTQWISSPLGSLMSISTMHFRFNFEIVTFLFYILFNCLFRLILYGFNHINSIALRLNNNWYVNCVRKLNLISFPILRWKVSEVQLQNWIDRKRKIYWMQKSLSFSIFSH